jgi:hypothetical protein
MTFDFIGLGLIPLISLTLSRDRTIAHLTLDLDVVPSAARSELINALPKRFSSYV